MAPFNTNLPVHRILFMEIPSDLDINPFRHLSNDLGTVLGLYKLWIPIFEPWSRWQSGALDELYPNFPNLRDSFLHVILMISQSLFLITLPISLATFCVFPFAINLVFLGIFWITNKVILGLLNGVPTSRCLIGVPEKHPPVNDESELWFFINGISIGYL